MKRKTLHNIVLVISCLLSPFVYAESSVEAATVNGTSEYVKDNVRLLKEKQSNQIVLDTDKDQVIDRHDQCPNTPKTNKVNKYGCTIYKKAIKEIAKTEIVEKKPEIVIEEVMTIKLLINFDNDKFNVRPQYLSEIERVAKFLDRYPHYSIVITGHTSSQGKAIYNKKLSQQRADQIANVLVTEFFIDKQRVSALGYGEEQLLDESNSPEAHMINRRVEGVVKLTQ